MFSRFYFPHIGGVEKHVQKISEILLKKGLKITLVTERFEEKVSKIERINGIDILRVKLLDRKGFVRFFNKFIIWIWLFRNIELIKKADIVHCHDVFFWYLPFRFIFPKKPIYVTFHGWEGKYPIPKRYIFYRKIWEKLSWGNICVGDYLKIWYGTKPNFVTYGGVDEDKEDKKLYKHLEGNKVVFVGRLEKDLGLSKYLKIFEKLREKNKNFIIEFYGNGPLEEKASRYGKVVGFTEKLYDKILDARFIFASSYLTVLEALFFKKNVVFVWENSLKKDYLLLSTFKNFLIYGYEVDKISKKILCLSKKSKEEEMVEKGYNWAKTQTWEKVADLYLKLWKVKIPEVST